MPMSEWIVVAYRGRMSAVGRSVVFILADGVQRRCHVTRATDLFVHVQVDTTSTEPSAQRTRQSMIKWHELQRWVVDICGGTTLFAHGMLRKLALDELAEWRDALHAMPERRGASAADG